jgi:hypothetical protein
MVMGDLDDDDRRHGMGIVIEYAGQQGKPQWVKPKPFRWDYTRFGKGNVAPPGPTLFHCHQQLHDFGFMALFNYA